MTGSLVPRFAAAAVFALLLSSCGDAGDSVVHTYKTPPGFNAVTGATVKMSANPPLSNAPDGDTRVVTVDGRKVDFMSWNEVVVPPGAHNLGVKYNGASSDGDATIRAVLQAGATYFVKGERDGPCDAVVWLQDQGSGQSLGDKRDTHLTAKPLSTGAPPLSVACN